MENNDSINEVTDRSKAIEWWNSLSALTQTQICDTHSEIIWNIRRRETLTGREMEMLHKCKCELHSHYA